jgi:HEAT repeat protein
MSQFRSGVVEVLGRFPGALPLIIKALGDPSARVRLAAVRSSAAIEGSAKPAIPHLRERLKDDSRTIREAAAVALQNGCVPATILTPNSVKSAWGDE